MAHRGLPPSQQEKCHQYWPAERSARYQYFVVDPMAEYNMPQYILREFKVTDARVSRQPFPEPGDRRQKFDAEENLLDRQETLGSNAALLISPNFFLTLCQVFVYSKLWP